MQHRGRAEPHGVELNGTLIDYALTTVSEV